VVKFRKRTKDVLLEYEPNFGGKHWIAEELRLHGEVLISKVFHFRTADLLEALPTTHDELDDFDEYEYRFRFAKRVNGYVRIEGRVLDIPNTVLIADNLMLERRLFAAIRDISIFRRLAKLVAPKSEIVVGGSRPDAIPIETYEDLLKRFPTTGELNRYAAARVATILGDHFEPLQDARARYERYLDRNRSTLKGAKLSHEALLKAELEKYVYIRDTIAEWLKSSDNRSEKDWQAMIINFLLLIFPKYVAVLDNVRIADFYSTPGKTHHRYIDLALVDAGGNIDVIEVKKPFEDALVAKGRYRDNSIPAKELAGSIMQAEKYLFHLSKWGVEGEKKLTAAHAGKLPSGLTIRVTNPKAMIIIGRDRKPNGKPALDPDQLFDLEVIKRKYANMMEIMTYDDLLRRLDNIIASLRTRAAT
jgi:hypothetical protein